MPLCRRRGPLPFGRMARPKYRDPAYRQARRAWASRVAAGEVACHLCGRAIAGPFHLDHVRGGGGALHPAHPRCNLIEGGEWKGKKRLADSEPEVKPGAGAYAFSADGLGDTYGSRSTPPGPPVPSADVAKLGSRRWISPESGTSQAGSGRRRKRAGCRGSTERAERFAGVADVTIRCKAERLGPRALACWRRGCSGGSLRPGRATGGSTPARMPQAAGAAEVWFEQSLGRLPAEARAERRLTRASYGAGRGPPGLVPAPTSGTELLRPA